MACRPILFSLSLFIIIDVASSLEISTKGSGTVGAELNMTCSVTDLQKPLLDDTTELIISLEKKDSGDEGSGRTIFNSNSSNNRTVQLSFNPLQYPDRGSYVCSLTVFNTSINSTSSIAIPYEYFTELNLTVKVPVPATSIEIAIPTQLPIFVGEHILLICHIELIQQNFDISHLTSVSWRKDNVIVSEDVVLMQENQTKHAFELSDVVKATYPVEYTCEVEVVPEINDPFITGVNYTNDLVLHGKDPPLLTVSHSGNAAVPGPYSIKCTVNMSTTYNISITLSWYKLSYPHDNNSTYELITSNTTGIFAKIYFDELSFDDAGTYICRAIINDDRIIAVAETQLLLTTPFNVTLKYGSPFYLIISWSEPLSFIGQSIDYTITTNSTQSQIMPLPLTNTDRPNTVSYNISKLRPFQYVDITITARSGVDEGDPVSIVFMTNDYVPDPVNGLSVSRMNEFSVLVTWEALPPAKVNGILIEYLINVYNSNLLLWRQLTAAPNITSIIITKLEPETRYSVEVVSRNLNYQSDPAQAIFYTIEGALAPPTNINVQMLNHTHIMITWVETNDTTKGSVQSYVVMTADQRTLTVPASSNDLIVKEDTGIYGFSIAAVNGDGLRGPWSQWITNAKSSYIQLRGGPFKSCSEWSESDRFTIISLFQQSLNNVTNSHCNCDYPVVYTLYSDSVSCDMTTPTDAIYRTNLTGIHPYSTTQLVDLISQWIMGGATIASGITQITLDSQCPVAIETANEPLCWAGSTTIGNKPDEGEGGEVILVSVLLAVVVLSCALLIVLCVYVLIWRTQRVQTWRFAPCPTPEGHPWVQDHKEHLQVIPTMFANSSIEGFEGNDEDEEEEAESTSEEGAGSPCKGSYDEGEKGDLESGVYDPSNLTIIYESDHESSKL